MYSFIKMALLSVLLVPLPPCYSDLISKVNTEGCSDEKKIIRKAIRRKLCDRGDNCKVIFHYNISLNDNERNTIDEEFLYTTFKAKFENQQYTYSYFVYTDKDGIVALGQENRYMYEYLK